MEKKRFRHIKMGNFLIHQKKQCYNTNTFRARGLRFHKKVRARKPLSNADRGAQQYLCFQAKEMIVNADKFLRSLPLQSRR